MRFPDWLEIVKPTPPGLDYAPDLFKQHGRAVQVDFEDGLDRRLARRHACSVYERRDRAELLPARNHRADGHAVGMIHLERLAVEAGLVHGLRDGYGIRKRLIADK